MGAIFGGGVAAAGATAAIVFLATPPGWIASLVVATGVAATSFAAGKGLKHVYTTSGRSVDLVGALGVDSLCSKPEPAKRPRTAAPGLSHVLT